MFNNMLYECHSWWNEHKMSLCTLWKIKSILKFVLICLQNIVCILKQIDLAREIVSGIFTLILYVLIYVSEFNEGYLVFIMLFAFAWLN